MPHAAESTIVVDPSPVDLAAIDRASGRLAAEAVRLALLDLEAGVAEEPPGSNRGKVVDRYLVGQLGDGNWLLHSRGAGKGAPWCARACRYWITEAATNLGMISPLGSAGLASALKWREWAKLRLRWKNEPAPGRVGILLDEDTYQGHVCLVLAVLDDGKTIESIDGNLRQRVACAHRPVSMFAGFVDIGA